MGFHRIRIILLAIFCVSLVLIVATFLLKAQLDAPLQNTEVSTPVSKADLTIQTVHLVENRGERKEWELTADSSETFQKENLTVLKNVKATFYPENRPVIYVEGREGRLRMDTKDMVISGDVKVNSEAGYSLKTQELRYYAKTRQVNTDQPVEMTQEGLIVKGVGLSANIDGKSLVVRRDVRATFQ